VVVARDLSLARLTGVKYHVQHVSTRGTIDLLREAREAGASVTSEVTPHHLVFDDEKVKSLDPVFKMYPPLRTVDDRTALQAALQSGLIDVVATDHAPHAAFETEVTFGEAPRGVIGLETAAAAVMTSCSLSIEDFFQRMSMEPAAIGQLNTQGHPIAEEAPANLVVFSSERHWVPNRFRSKGANSPFLGQDLHGLVLATIFQGRITHQLAGAIS
jgi:dihydroorotase